MVALSMIWEDLCIWLDARLLGPFPARRMALVEYLSAHQPGDPYPFSVEEIQHAGDVWRQFQSMQEYSLLNDPLLSHVLEGVGFLLGEALGLSFTAATYFGAWLAQAITDIGSEHGNDYVIAACETIASGAVYGEDEQHASGASGPEFWQRYPNGVRAVVDFLRA